MKACLYHPPPSPTMQENEHMPCQPGSPPPPTVAGPAARTWLLQIRPINGRKCTSHICEAITRSGRSEEATPPTAMCNVIDTLGPPEGWSRERVAEARPRRHSRQEAAAGHWPSPEGEKRSEPLFHPRTHPCDVPQLMSSQRRTRRQPSSFRHSERSKGAARDRCLRHRLFRILREAG